MVQSNTAGTAKVEIILFSAHGYDQPFETIETKYEVDALDSKVVNTTAIKRKLVAKGHNLQQAIVRLSTKAQGDRNGGSCPQVLSVPPPRHMAQSRAQ